MRPASIQRAWFNKCRQRRSRFRPLSHISRWSLPSGARDAWPTVRCLLPTHEQFAARCHSRRPGVACLRQQTRQDACAHSNHTGTGLSCLCQLRQLRAGLVSPRAQSHDCERGPTSQGEGGRHLSQGDCSLFPGFERRTTKQGSLRGVGGTGRWDGQEGPVDIRGTVTCQVSPSYEEQPRCMCWLGWTRRVGRRRARPVFYPSR